jgi:hypothetical protein
MDHINTKSKFIQNYLNADDFKELHKNYLSKLKTISFSILSKFEELNGKFDRMFDNAKRRIDNEISLNTSIIFFIIFRIIS